MKILCYECGQKYNIDETKIKGQSIQVKCKKCGFMIKVNKPETIASTSFFEDPTQSDGPVDMFSSGNAPRLNETPDIPGLSIRTKIIVTIVVLLFVALTVVGSISSIKNSRILSEQAERFFLMYTEQKVKEYDLVFEKIQAESQSAADYSSMTYAREDITTEITSKILMPWNGSGYALEEVSEKTEREIFSLQRIQLYIKSIVKNNPYFIQGYMGTETGLTVFNDDSIVTQIEETDAYLVRQRPWYLKAKEAGKTIWTKPYLDANTKKLVVHCATPVFEGNGNIVGVIGFGVLLETIQESLLNIDIGYDSYAFMVDVDGKVLGRSAMIPKDSVWAKAYETEDLSHTKNKAFSSIIQKIISGQSGIELYSLDKNEKYITYAPIKFIDGSLAIVISKDLVIKPARDIQKLITIIICVVLFISLLSGFILGNSVTKPLIKLTVLANLISTGQLELELMDGEDRQDEIGVLTKSINRLVVSLKLAMKK